MGEIHFRALGLSWTPANCRLGRWTLSPARLPSLGNIEPKLSLMDQRYIEASIVIRVHLPR